MRVLFANNYPADEARELWRLGEYPGHHLFGANELEARGHAVDYLPWHGQSDLLARAYYRLGNVPVEFEILRRRGGDTVVYAAAPALVRGLAVLRGLGVVRRPLLVVANAAVIRGAIEDRAWRGADLMICLSKRIHADLLAAGREAASTIVLPWGPDLSFAGYSSTTDEFIVSSGKTHRDLRTLVQAAAVARLPVRIHVPSDVGLPSTVESRIAVGYAEVLADLRAAAIVAIPLADVTAPYGITELNDALAFGKPVVMTSSPHIDVDIEAIGCGFWVEQGDVAGWERAFRALADPAAREEMGAKGRAFAQRQWNARLFGEGVVAAAERLL